MKNDLNISSLKDSINNAKEFIVKYRHVLFIILVASVVGFMFIRIAKMSTAEPKDYQINEVKTVQKLKLNEDSIEIIQNLQDRNISIQALFDPGRYDPFND